MSKEALERQLKFAEDYMEEKVAHVAKTMRSFANQVEHDAALTADPGSKASYVIQAAMNMHTNLRLDLLPVAVQGVMEARAALTEEAAG